MEWVILVLVLVAVVSAFSAYSKAHEAKVRADEALAELIAAA